MGSWTAMLPNVLSGARLGMVPVLWIVALHGQLTVLGLGLIIAGITDVLDGYAARRFDAVTPAGARLDSLADNVLVLSGVAWLIMLRPDVVDALFWPLYAWLTLYFAFLLVGWFRFRRFGNLHLWSGKASAFLCYVFLVSCLLFPGVPYVTFWITFMVSALSLIEGIVVMMTRDEVSEDLGSVFRG